MCDRLQELRESVQAYTSSFDASRLTPTQAREVVSECSVILSSVSAMRDLAAACAAAGSWQKRGHRSPADELAADTGTTTAAAKRRIEHGKRLASQPELAGAALSGAISPELAAIVAAGIEARPEKAAELIEAAKQQSLPELADRVRKERAQATDAEARRLRIHHRRSFRRFTDLDGAFNGQICGHVEDGALLFTTLDAIKRRLAAVHASERCSFDALNYDSLMVLAAVAAGRTAQLDLIDLLELGLFPQLDSDLLHTAAHAQGASRARAATEGAEDGGSGTAPPTGSSPHESGRGPGCGCTSPDDPDSVPGARSADAALGAPGSEPGNGGCPPAVAGSGPAVAALVRDRRPTVQDGRPHVEPARVTAQRHRRPKLAFSPVKILVRVDLDTLLRGSTLEGELCEIDGYGPIAVSVVKDLAANGNAFVVGLLTRSERVLGVYRLRRRPSTAQRSALEFLYPSCAAAGCSTRVGLQADHREDWARTKFTVLDLLDRLCPHHHKLKTEQGWQLVQGHGKRAFVSPSDPRHPCNVAAAIPTDGSGNNGPAGTQPP